MKSDNYELNAVLMCILLLKLNLHGNNNVNVEYWTFHVWFRMPIHICLPNRLQ